MTFPRRRFLRTGLGLTAAAALPFAAGCAGIPDAAPTGARVAEGVYSVRIGGATVTALADGVAVRPLAEGFVRNATLAQVEQALREANMPTDKITISFTAFLVESGGKRILIDTGNGRFGAPTSGRVLSNLQAAGVSPGSIDHILISHFHGDHINGIRNKEGALVYPKAQVHAPVPEWDFWMSDAETARQTRLSLLDQTVAENWLVSGYHMPFPAIGRIARRGSGYDFSAMA